MALTAKQATFVAEYLVSLNAADAARRAGYAPKTARAAGCKLLQEPEVAQAVREARDKRCLQLDVTADRLVRELAAIAFLDPRTLFEWGPDGVTVKPSEALGGSEASAVAEASLTVTPAGRSIKIRPHDKLTALRMLKEILGIGAQPGDKESDAAEAIGNDEDPPVAPE